MFALQNIFLKNIQFFGKISDTFCCKTAYASKIKHLLEYFQVIKYRTESDVKKMWANRGDKEHIHQAIKSKTYQFTLDQVYSLRQHMLNNMIAAKYWQLSGLIKDTFTEILKLCIRTHSFMYESYNLSNIFAE